jgi:transcriptional regulator with XRE-family HTH domain
MPTTALLPPFARNLRFVMAEREMTQEELSRRLDVSLRAVSGWCLGERIPHPHTVERIAGIFERSVEWLRAEHDIGR